MKRRSIFRKARLDIKSLERRHASLEKRLNKLMGELVNTEKLIAVLKQVPTAPIVEGGKENAIPQTGV